MLGPCGGHGGQDGRAYGCTDLLAGGVQASGEPLLARVDPAPHRDRCRRKARPMPKAVTKRPGRTPAAYVPSSVTRLSQSCPATIARRPPISTSAQTSEATVRPEPKPCCSPLVSPKMSAARATVTRSAPSPSTRSPRRRSPSGSRPANANSTPISGRLTRKIARQPMYSVKRPPATIPVVAPAAVVACHSPPPLRALTVERGQQGESRRRDQGTARALSESRDDQR